MACGGLMSAPVCLIENDVNGKLYVRKEAKDVLDGIMEPVVVVSVVGLYRTGKSYLMNRLAGQQSGFALGNTVESQTKGIWMWCVPHPSKEGHTLVLLDTEGLGDVDKGDSKNDGWIFCLAVLLSSALVYNSRGTIDNNALENLHYVTELAGMINIKSSEAADEQEEEHDFQFVQFFPSFIWAVRDFTLVLEIKGKKVTEDEYLNFALNPKKGQKKMNLSRECLRNYFPSRNCFVFPLPTSQENLRCLESLQEKDLVPDFVEATFRFCKHIYDNSAVKTIKGGDTVNGKLFGDLVQIYVNTIGTGTIPCLDNAVLMLAIQQNEAAVEKALQSYQSEMEKVKNKFPISMEDITSEHKKISSLALTEFIKHSFRDEDQAYAKKLEEALLKCYVDLLEDNKKASEKKCRDLLRNLFSDMNKRLQDGEYSQSGGYELYCRHRDAIVEQYSREPNKGVRAEAVLSKFRSERATEAKTISHADEKITECHREIEEEKENTALLEQMYKEQEEKRIQSELILEVERERNEENINQMQEKFDKDREQLREEMERAIQIKLKEQEEMQKRGFSREAESLHKEIKKLQTQLDESWSVGGVIGQAFGNAIDILTGKGWLW